MQLREIDLTEEIEQYRKNLDKLLLKLDRKDKMKFIKKYEKRDEKFQKKTLKK